MPPQEKKLLCNVAPAIKWAKALEIS
jgi:hypothetical protein